jgi:uncharacterized membrane protein
VLKVYALYFYTAVKVFVCNSYLIFPFLHISIWSLIVLFLKLSMQSVRCVCYFKLYSTIKSS